MEKFKELFKFNSSKAFFVGIERECFLTNKHGEIIPIANKVLEYMVGPSLCNDSWGYELSACQLESRSTPCVIDKLKTNLEVLEKEVLIAEKKVGFLRSHFEVASENMPLDVFPDPTGRYQEIVKKMPREILLAACRVIGTHVHIGMPNYEVALRVYNGVTKHTDRLSKLGDKSKGQRLEIYKTVCPDCKPPIYSDWHEFHAKAVEKNFVFDPRKCWTLIRISKNGTIEFRMFGTTDDIDEIVGWAKDCYSICKEALL